MTFEIYKNKPRHRTQTTGLTHEGRGIANINGKTVFLFGALDQEEVEFIYEQRHAKFDEGLVTEVIHANAQRIQPECEYFGVCGGCSLQHMPHQMQLQQKQQAFQELLAHLAHCQPKTWLAPLTGPIWGYRNKARLSAKLIHKKEKVVVGFRERKGRFVADIDHCKILHPSVGKHIHLLSQLIYQLSIPDQIPQIEIAVSENISALIIRHMKPFAKEDEEKLITFAKQYHFRIYLQPKGPDSIHLFTPKDVDPTLRYTLEADQIQLQFLPQQFTQINSDINRIMLAQALHLLELTPQDNVLDLFCGIGNFTLPIAKKVCRVVGVEGDASAVKMATQNALLNQLTHCEFHCVDLFQPLPATTWTQCTYDKLLLDPPRSGTEQIVPFLSQWKPKRIVYISCNPATLARDTGLIQKQGYTLEKAGIMDMFPHTQHVEAMALFTNDIH